MVVIPSPLKKLVREWKDCEKCPLHKTAHLHVFYRGSCPCDVLFVGEAPGRDEDLYGEPFIGRAGQLQDEMIADAIEELLLNDAISRQMYDPIRFGFTNIVACRPYDCETNKLRIPTVDEAKTCNPRYAATLAAAKPKLIILLGKTAKKYHKFLPKSLASIPAVELQHPSHILRPPNDGKGSYAYESNMLALVKAMETHLYVTETETEDASKQARAKNKAAKKKVSLRSKSSRKAKT